MTNLKPCPFCGGTPATVVDDASESLFGVKCFRCGGSVEAEKQTLAEAVAAWNRRSGESWACIDGVVQKVGHVTLFAPQEVEKDKGQERDCIHHDPKNKRCFHGNVWYALIRSDHDFCSYGERRSDE